MPSCRPNAPHSPTNTGTPSRWAVSAAREKIVVMRVWLASGIASVSTTRSYPWGEYAQAVSASGGIGAGMPMLPKRSEEHTSELQSRFDLVCRLLLEKKKQ